MAQSFVGRTTPLAVDNGGQLPPAHTTAYQLNKQYSPGGAVSGNVNKSADRPEDGYVTSQFYAARSPHLKASTRPGHLLDLDFQHPLERWLARDFMRRLLGFIAHPRRGRQTIIEEVLHTYHDPAAPLGQRLLYWPLHKFIDRMKGALSVESFRRWVSERTDVVRGLVATARTVAEFGLTVPQRFSSPLFCVWNFTNRCNLRCQHCYQDADHQGLADELTLDEKLKLVGELAELYVPMIAFAGGEPTISPDFLPVVRRCHALGMHMSVATNGSTMTPRLAAELAEAGAKYIEISLDSVHPEKHDAFRGQPGMWHRTVRGMRYVVQQPGLRLGIAMCVTQGNFGEVDEMLQFAQDIGAGCVAHFNFIPVGRGLKMVAGDITPRQRQWLLDRLNTLMQAGKIGVISTAPQLGRVALAGSPLDGRQTCSHCGSGSGVKARVIAKYLGGCGAGRTYACIEPDGDITPCVYMPQRVLGNVRQRPFADIFRHNAFWDLLCDRSKFTHHCEVCRFKNYCGGCRARADAYFGAVNAGDPGCIFNEKHWEDLVRQGAALEAAEGGAGEEAAALGVKGYDGCVTSWSAGPAAAR